MRSMKTKQDIDWGGLLSYRYLSANFVCIPNEARLMPHELNEQHSRFLVPAEIKISTIYDNRSL